MTRAVIYTRKSRQVGANVASLETQEADCRSDCAQHGDAVVEVVRDIGERDELEGWQGLTKVRQMFAQGLADVLVVWRYDRLSGDQLQQSVLVYEIEKKCGGKIRSTREQFEDGPTGELMRTITAFGANLEVRAIRERINRGKIGRVERGELLPHAAPLYGYDWADARKTAYTIVPEKVKVVERIFKEVAAGVGYRPLIRGLERDGIPSPTGKNWSHSQLRRMVENPA